jgi:magnesium transporter
MPDFTTPREARPTAPRRKRKRTPPKPGERNDAFSYYRTPNGDTFRDLDVAGIVGALEACVAASPDGAPANGQLWVDIDTTDPAQLAMLADIFHFHPLAIEDTLNDESRVRIEEYESYIFAIVRGVAFQAETPDPYDLKTENISVFLGSNYLVTVHAGPAPSVATVRSLVESNPLLMQRGVGRVAHLVMDEAVDAYFPVLDGIDDFFDEVEPRVFTDFDENALHEIFQLKRLVLALRRFLAPQREVFNVLANRPTRYLTVEEQRYFADVHDHVMRIYDGIDAARELSSNTLDSYLTQVSNRTGNATKSLSVVATLSIPFVVISGMWGMNFARVPYADARHGFWYMVAVQLLIGFVLVYWLRRRKLL